MNSLLANIDAARGATRHFGRSYDSNPSALFSANTYGGQSVRSASMNGAQTGAQPSGIPRSVLPMNFGMSGEAPNPFENLFPEHEDSVNPRVTPFARHYRTIGNGVNLRPPGVYHLSLILRQMQNHDNVSLMQGRVRVMGEALTAVTPLQWNLLMGQQQMQLAEKNPIAFRNLTPRDVMLGDPIHERDANGQTMSGPFSQALNIAYHGWAFDGVIQFEDSRGGGTTLSEGYLSDRLGLISGLNASAGKYVTPAYRGSALMADYFHGRGLAPGATLWGVVKKFPTSVAGKEPIEYDMAHKPIGVAINGDYEGESVKMTLSRPNVKPRDGPNDIFAIPFEMGFFSVPSGDVPDPAYCHYKDEWGSERTDGLLLPIGRLLFTTPGVKYMPPPEADTVEPLRNGREILRDTNRKLLGVVVNTDEGLFQESAFAIM